MQGRSMCFIARYYFTRKEELKAKILKCHFFFLMSGFRRGVY
jgi:hypothetical protein